MQEVINIKLEQLNYIIEVAKTNSIRQASKNLFLTQPTISSAIKSIEDELNIEIFSRSRDGVKLTSSGMEFIKLAENISSNMKQISNISKNKSEKTSIKFNISSQLFSYTLDTFFNFHSKYESYYTDFKLNFCTCLDAIKNVYNKDCEIALIYIHNDNNKSWYNLFNSYNMDFIPLSDSHLHICVGCNHPLYDRSYAKLEDLYDSTLVLYDDYSESSLYKELINKINFDEFKNKITIYDYYSYFNVIETKNVFSFVPIFDKFTSKSYTKNILNLRNIPFDNMPTFTFGYVKLSNTEISDISCEFIDMLRMDVGY